MARLSHLLRRVLGLTTSVTPRPCRRAIDTDFSIFRGKIGVQSLAVTTWS